MLEEYRDADDPSSPETNSTSVESDHQSFVFGYSSANVNMRDLHPLPSQLPFYLQIYAARVDPVVKILHMPSMEKAIKEAQENHGSLTRSKEALLFSIYFAVISWYAT